MNKKSLTIKEILIRLIVGAILIEKNKRYVLSVYQKGEIAISREIGNGLIIYHIVELINDVSINKKIEKYYEINLKLIKEQTNICQKELKVFGVHLKNAKHIDESTIKRLTFGGIDIDAFEEVKNKGQQSHYLYVEIKKEFCVWYKERQIYLKKVENL